MDTLLEIPSCSESLPWSYLKAKGFVLTLPIHFCSILFHFYSLESPVSITTFSMGSFGRKSSFTKVSLSQLFGGSPCPPPFPFNLSCALWPGPSSSTQAFWEPGLLKMVITAGFLLVPRLFLFTKAGQAWPLRGTHIRVGILSRPLGYSSLTFFIETSGLPFFVPLYVLCCSLDPQVTWTVSLHWTQYSIYTSPDVLQSLNFN